MSFKNILGITLGAGCLLAVFGACTSAPSGETTPTRVLETYIRVSFGARGLEDKREWKSS